MSPKFELIKGYYEDGLWDKRRVYNVVGVGALTPEEYELITGEKYVK